MYEQAHKVADVLLALEMELRRLELWESQAPPQSALESAFPFCYDTLEFTQWLQWVLIPRLRPLLERGEGPPQACEIAPLAEDELARLEEDTDRLLGLIQSLDRELTRLSA